MDRIIMAILIVAIIAAAVLIIWATPLSSSADSAVSLQHEMTVIREIMAADAHLHRLLLVERYHGLNSETSEHAVTFQEMQRGMEVLGKNFISTLGRTMSRRITAVMQARNQILHDFYGTLRKTVPKLRRHPLPSVAAVAHVQCADQREHARPHPQKIARVQGHSDEYGDDSDEEPVPHDCESAMKPPMNSSTEEEPVSDSGSEEATEKAEVADDTPSPWQQLDDCNRELINSITSAFQIRSVNKSESWFRHLRGTSASPRPILQYDRLYSLLGMYDREIIYAATLYANEQYSASLACSAAIADLARKVSDEFRTIMTGTLTRINRVEI